MARCMHIAVPVDFQSDILILEGEMAEDAAAARKLFQLVFRRISVGRSVGPRPRCLFLPQGSFKREFQFVDALEWCVPVCPGNEDIGSNSFHFVRPVGTKPNAIRHLDRSARVPKDGWNPVVCVPTPCTTGQFSDDKRSLVILQCFGKILCGGPRVFIDQHYQRQLIEAFFIRVSQRIK